MTWRKNNSIELNLYRADAVRLCSSRDTRSGYDYSFEDRVSRLLA